MVCDAIHIENEHDVNFIYIQMGEEVKRYYEWLNFICEIKGYTDLNEDQLSLLDYLSGYKYFTTAGKKAMAVLNEYYEEDHFIPAHYADQLATPRSYMLNSNGQPEVHLIQVYPNPARDFIQVQLQLKSVYVTNEKLEIRDVAGNLIEQFKINSKNQFYVLDLTSYASGQYQLILSKDSHVLEALIVSVVH